MWSLALFRGWECHQYGGAAKGKGGRREKDFSGAFLSEVLCSLVKQTRNVWVFRRLHPMIGCDVVIYVSVWKKAPPKTQRSQRVFLPIWPVRRWNFFDHALCQRRAYEGCCLLLRRNPKDSRPQKKPNLRQSRYLVRTNWGTSCLGDPILGSAAGHVWTPRRTAELPSVATCSLAKPQKAAANTVWMGKNDQWY